MTGHATQHSVVLLRRGPSWDPAKPLIEQARAHDHLAYLGRLHAEGVLERGGPFHPPSQLVVGDLVGMLVYAVGRERALEYATEDPAARAGLLACEVHSWYP